MGIFQRNIILTHVFLFYCLAPTDAIPAKPAKLCAGRCHHLQCLKMCHHHCTHLCLLGLAASAPPCALPSGPSRSGSHHRALLPLPLCTSIPPMLKHRGSGSGRVSAVVKWGTLPSPHHMALPQVSPRVLIPNLLRPQDLTYHFMEGLASYWDTHVLLHSPFRKNSAQESVSIPCAHRLLQMCPQRHGLSVWIRNLA